MSMEVIYHLIDFSDLKTIVSIVSVTIGAAIIAFLKSSIFQEFLNGIAKWFGDRKKSKKIDTNDKENVSEYDINEDDIINHDIFNYIDFWIYNQIPSMVLKTQYRTAIFRKYLHIYLTTYKNVISEFVYSKNYKSMSSSNLRKTLLKLITTIIREMESDMRSANIPEVIILKMKNVLNDRINLTIDLIDSVCDSSFYNGSENYLKIYTFLNIIHSILDNTISNISPVCNELNGELSGLSVDGFTEPTRKKKK